MSRTRSRAGWYIAVAIVIVVIVIAGVLLYQYTQPGTNNNLSGNNINIYAGEYTFGTSSSALTSPGPTLTFSAGQSVTITLHNVGNAPHNFAITTDRADGSTNLAFNGAQIGTATNPVPVGRSASTTFTVGQAGTYYYICQVDGHASLGMWGTVTVTS